jgi:hypothetical protein
MVDEFQSWVNKLDPTRLDCWVKRPGINGSTLSAGLGPYDTSTDSYIPLAYGLTFRLCSYSGRVRVRLRV